MKTILMEDTMPPRRTKKARNNRMEYRTKRHGERLEVAKRPTRETKRVKMPPPEIEIMLTT